MHEQTNQAEARHWFAAQVRPNCESIAARNLRRQGFCVFAPFEEQDIRRVQRFIQVRKPLFPGYMFVSPVAERSPWHAINATRGVRKLVSSSAGRPSLIPPAFIAGLMERCDTEGRLLPASRFTAGDIVRIVSGPFASLTATVEHMAPQQRVWVLLDILGGEKRVAAYVADLAV